MKEQKKISKISLVNSDILTLEKIWMHLDRHMFFSFFWCNGIFVQWSWNSKKKDHKMGNKWMRMDVKWIGSCWMRLIVVIEGWFIYICLGVLLVMIGNDSFINFQNRSHILGELGFFVLMGWIWYRKLAHFATQWWHSFKIGLSEAEIQ